MKTERTRKSGSNLFGRKNIGRLAQRVMNIVLTLTILFGVFASLGVPFTQAAISYDSDLNKYVSTVQIFDKKNDDEVIDGGECIKGDEYLIQISFSEIDDGRQFKHDSEGFLVYNLPANLILTETYNGVEIIDDKTDEVVGYFYADAGTNVIKVKFLEVEREVNGVTSQKIFFDHFENTTFFLFLDATFTQLGDNQDIDFGNGVTIEVTVEQHEPEIELAKDAVLDRDNEIVEYTVSLTAEKGDWLVHDFWDEPRITDCKEIAGEGFYWNLNEYIIGKTLYIDVLSADGTLKGLDIKAKKDGTGDITYTIDNDLYNMDGYFQRITFDFPGGGFTLLEGETLLVTYEIDY
ncbi:MAG: hypothetical protein FWG21_03650, partial [Oscillospiraceae bacterium]|nr:hypothetical protein [Oscillospiraceae bacterium]